MVLFARVRVQMGLSHYWADSSYLRGQGEQGTLSSCTKKWVCIKMRILKIGWLPLHPTPQNIGTPKKRGENTWPMFLKYLWGDPDNANCRRCRIPMSTGPLQASLQSMLLKVFLYGLSAVKEYFKKTFRHDQKKTSDRNWFAPYIALVLCTSSGEKVVKYRQ